MELSKNWVILWLGISFFVCAMLTGFWFNENWKMVEMAKQGYEEIPVIGQQDFAWQKAK